jgi:hypothetical protein
MIVNGILRMSPKKFVEEIGGKLEEIFHRIATQ